jgi:hypothetical protein
MCQKPFFALSKMTEDKAKIDIAFLAVLVAAADGLAACVARSR